MLKVKATLLISFAFVLFLSALTACMKVDGDNTGSEQTITDSSSDESISGTIIGSETLPADETGESSSTPMDEIIESFPDTLTYKGYGIYLSFGARGTLTVENFNRRVLTEQLGLDTDKYSFVIAENVLLAIRQNEAYGGIGYGQEWSGIIPIAIKDIVTGEVSEIHELPFILHKTTEANEELTKETE